jgi:hypothetical protein
MKTLITASNVITFSEYSSSINGIGENLRTATVVSEDQVPTGFSFDMFCIPFGREDQAENYYRLYVNNDVQINSSSLFFAVHCPNEY